MEIKYNVPVKYTKRLVDVIVYDTGISDWQDIEECYRGAILRDKVVCRIDATYVLYSYFKKETIEKYRPVFMYIIKGLSTDAEKFSACIKDLMNEDETFRSRIRDIYNSCPEDCSFGWHIINTLANAVLSVEAAYRSFFRGKPEVVVCLSDGYLYFSVEDSDRITTLPCEVNCEVISHAKNWRGTIQFHE